MRTFMNDNNTPVIDLAGDEYRNEPKEVIERLRAQCPYAAKRNRGRIAFMDRKIYFEIEARRTQNGC